MYRGAGFNNNATSRNCKFSIAGGGADDAAAAEQQQQQHGLVAVLLVAASAAAAAGRVPISGPLRVEVRLQTVKLLDADGHACERH